MNARRSADPERAQARHLSEIPYTGPWRLFCFCLAGLGLIWLPLAVLQQIDAILKFATPRELASDVALLLLLLALTAALLAISASLCELALRAFRMPTGARRTVAWALVGVPVGLLCAWQAAYAIKLWLEQVFEVRLTTAGLPYRQLWILIPVIVVSLLWRTFGRAQLIHAVSEPLLRLKVPALVAVTAAAACVAWQPPAISIHGSSLSGAPEAAAPISPDIYLISLDTLAAEDASICGDGPTLMPNLRRLADRSSCFTHHYAASNLTFPSTATIETGTLPWTHWVMFGGRAAPQVAENSLGHVLQRAGYSTHAITAAHGATPLQHGTYLGYNSVTIAASDSLQMKLQNAVQEFPDSRSIHSLLSAVLSLLWIVDVTRLGDHNPYPPEYVYGPALTLVDSHRTSRPLYIWTHTWLPHSPYLPPASTKYRLLPPGEFEHIKDFITDVGTYDAQRQPAVDKQRLRYQETIMAADEKLGRFLDGLDQRGRLDQALVIVTSDHGESFERGVLGHGDSALHEAVVRIPLLIKLPGQRIAQLIHTPTSQADLAPTLIDFIGGKASPLVEGRSLKTALMGKPISSVPVFSMAMAREGRFRPIRGGHYVVIDAHHKLVCHLPVDRCQLYDLAADPREQRDLAEAEPKTATRLRDLLKARMAQADARRLGWFGNR